MPGPRACDVARRPVGPARIGPATFWICDFILWIFGVCFNLLGKEQPASSAMMEFVATTTAVVLTLVAVFTLVGRPTYARVANRLIVAHVYSVFNVVFFVDATQAWEYSLGVFSVLFIGLIFWRAYTWHPRAGGISWSRAGRPVARGRGRRAGEGLGP